MSEAHNLDTDVTEYFEFKIFGHIYKFRYLTTAETEEFQTKATAGRQEFEAFLYQFISPVSPNAPDFKTLAKKMIIPQWRNFTTMIKAEFSMG